MNLLHEVLHEVFEKVLYSVYYQTRGEKQNAPSLVYWVYNGWNAHVIPVYQFNEFKKGCNFAAFFFENNKHA